MHQLWSRVKTICTKYSEEVEEHCRKQYMTESQEELSQSMFHESRQWLLLSGL